MNGLKMRKKSGMSYILHRVLPIRNPPLFCSNNYCFKYSGTLYNLIKHYVPINYITNKYVTAKHKKTEDFSSVPPLLIRDLDN